LKKTSKVFIGFAVILIVVIVAIIGGNLFLESKLETAIKENANNTEIEYEHLNASILGRSASLENLVYSKNGLEIIAEEIKIEGIDILQYLKNKKIEITTVRLQKPEISLYSDAQKDKDTSGGNKSGKIDLLVKSVELIDGSFKMAKNDSVKAQLFARIPSFNLSEISVDKNSVKTGIPFEYAGMEMTSDSLFFNMDSRHDMFVQNIILKDNSLKFREINIKPLYDKQEFQQHIPYEKDRFEISLKTLDFKSLDWKFENDSLRLKSDFINLANADLKIYRDKQAKDDTRQKPMYSKMIRELPFKIKLDTIKLENFAIQYEELVKPKRGPGKVTFKNLDASIYNVTNFNLNSEDFPRTDIDVETQFQGEAKLKVNWNFDISNTADTFRISGQMDRISSEGINQFMQPALNVKAEGGIRDMRFNFSGINERSTGDMKLVYNNFKVEVLQADGEEKNNLLSALANLIVNNEATSAEKEQENIKTRRTKTKSFWNYLWKNIRNGALKSFL